MTVVIPAVAMAVSTVFEGYRWSAGAVAGMALVVAGIALVLRAKVNQRDVSKVPSPTHAPESR